MTTFALDARSRTQPRTAQDKPELQVLSYGVMLILLFFSLGGFLPWYSSTQDASSDTVMGQLFQLCIWIVALALMRSSLKGILRLCWRMKWITAIALLAPASALWSQIPENSLRRGVFLILCTLFAFYLVQRFKPLQLAQVVVLSGVMLAVLNILTCVAIPSVGVDPGGCWQALCRAKNNLAQIMLFFLAAAVPFTFPTRAMNFLRYLLFFLALILIVMSKAKTSWLLGPAYFVLIGIGAWLRKMHRRDALFLVLMMMFGLACFAALVPYLLPFVLDLLGKDAGLTGRVPLWQATLLSIMKRPLLGYGYASFWNGMQGESLNVFMGAHFLIFQAQNGILEIWLQLGIVGVILVLVTLFEAGRSALLCFQHGHSTVVNWYVGLIALSVAYNFDEAFFATAHHIGWLFYMVACTGLSVEADIVRSAVKVQRLRAPGPVRRSHLALGH